MAFVELAAVAKIAAVVLVSAGIGAGVYFVAEEGTSDGPEDAPQVVATRAVPTPEPLSPPEQVDRPPTATGPTATPPPAPGTPAPPPERAERCPDGWQLFDNTVLHYSICYPSDWGIWNGTSADPVLDFTDRGLRGEITLAGPGYFPRPVDVLTVDQLPPDVRQRVEQAAKVSVGASVGPDVGTWAGCTPDTRLDAAGVDALWCETAYTAEGDDVVEFQEDGETRIIRALFRLPSPPTEISDWLLVSPRSPRSTHPDRAPLFWQIIRSVAVY